MQQANCVLVISTFTLERKFGVNGCVCSQDVSLLSCMPKEKKNLHFAEKRKGTTGVGLSDSIEVDVKWESH